MSAARIAMATVLLAGTLNATEFHVSPTGENGNAGTATAPFKTIGAAAAVAQPGDTITVHAGVYRERVAPPRGGESDAKRITYQAAPGEEVTVTGADVAKGWTRVTNDTWKLSLPNSYFGAFNPYATRVHGDWFDPHGRVHHTGMVFLNGHWLMEAASHLNEVLALAGKQPLWFGKADGVEDVDYLLNLVNVTVGPQRIAATSRAAKSGELREAGCSEGGQCMGWIRSGSWLKFDKVDFGAGTEKIECRAASVTGGGDIEIRLGGAEGEVIGRCVVEDTGDWQKWATFTAAIKPTRGEQSLCLVFRSHAKSATSDTTIWAQFPGVNPNEANVEILARPTVFTPEKTNINYITVRGFKLRGAASNWAAPTSGQHGLVTAYWCKGWIIEDNEISYSRCCGIALGKYSDEWDNRRGNKEGYDGTIADALATGGWTKEKIGGHVVRRNHIHHCGQTGIVGSLGCAFSRVEGNEIHDINNLGIWGGAEMAGIKFHGALDVVIKGNHIYRCGPAGGLWLDWMAQGTQVLGNLFHDNAGHDIFTEVDHGPFVIANNILLSPAGYLANSQGGAYAHNLILGSFSIHYDGRQTPYHKAHSTELAGRRDCPIGDARWYNNLFAERADLGAYNGAVLPVAAAGNVYARGAKASKHDRDAILRPEHDLASKLEQKGDGWYLTLAVEGNWTENQKRPLVASEILGKAVIPDLPFENADGTPIRIDTDYLGKKRSADNPFPGPFEIPEGGRQSIKVWPIGK